MTSAKVALALAVVMGIALCAYAANFPSLYVTGTSRVVGKTTNDFLTASRIVVTGSDKSVASSSATSTEAGYLSGVTSAIQTQLDAKSAIPTQITLTHAGSVSLTFAALQSWATLSLTGNVTLTSTALAAGHSYTIYGRNPKATNCIPTFPSWCWQGSPQPTNITALKPFTISLFSTGTVDTNVWAVYVEGP